MSLKAEGRYLDGKRETRVSFDELAARYRETFPSTSGIREGQRLFPGAVLETRFAGLLSDLTFSIARLSRPTAAPRPPGEGCSGVGTGC